MVTSSASRPTKEVVSAGSPGGARPGRPGRLLRFAGLLRRIPVRMIQDRMIQDRGAARDRPAARSRQAAREQRAALACRAATAGRLPPWAARPRRARSIVSGRRMPVEIRLLAEYRLVQPVQPRVRVDAELVGEPGPQLAVGTQRVSLAAASVQGGHPLAAQSLPERISGGQPV